MQFSFDTFFLKPINIKDAWGLCNFVNANEDRLRRYFPKTLAQNLTPNLSGFFVEKKIKQFQNKEEFLFTIKELQSNNLIGLVYIKELDWVKKQAELAYCISYQFEGKGFTTKSVKTLSDYAFNNLHLETLQIIVHKTNFSSVKVAENCNFIWKKTLKNKFTPFDGNTIDMELYELYNKIET